MFERYTEKARRVIFFGRYEASRFGSSSIETEHLLLGLLREDKGLTHRFLRNTKVEAIREQIEAATAKGEYISTSVDLPLSDEGRRVLAYAAEEAERLSHRHIGTEHLLLGLLREERSFAAQILHERGLRAAGVREQLVAAALKTEAEASAEKPVSPAKFRVDLTQQAHEGQLHPFVGREKEMERLMQILGRSTKNNAVLVGEPGVGKRAIVEGLAQNIAESKAPSFLLEKDIVALDMAFFAGSQHALDSEVFAATTHTIFFMDELHSLLAAAPTGGAPGPSETLKAALLGGKFQCICAAIPEEYAQAREKHRWLDDCFSAIDIASMTEAEALAVLMTAKAHLEKFHSVTYTDNAIRHAVRYACVFIKDRQLPDKALDLMDEAAAYVNARPVHLPEEIIEAHKRIKFIVHRLENCIINLEFEKSRFYSDEERKERDNLRELFKKHNIDEASGSRVTRQDIEEVLARWLGVPVSKIREARLAVDPEAPDG